MPRRIEPELLDLATDDEARANLADLRRINRWFGGHSALRHVLRGYERASILDVGAASGEVTRVFPAARVVSLDMQLRNLQNAPQPAVAADAFHLPFADHAFDVIACSLFLHHFEDESIIRLLVEFRRVARVAVAIVDLERHWLAERFLPLTQPLFGWSRLTVHDGPASVRAAFRRGELARLAQQSGLTKAREKRHFPWFRILLIATLEGGDKK